MPYTGITSVKRNNDNDNNYSISTDSSTKRINSVWISDDLSKLVVFYYDGAYNPPQFATKSSETFGSLTTIPGNITGVVSYFGGQYNDYGSMSNDGSRLVLARWGPGTVFTTKWNGTAYDSWTQLWSGGANNSTLINSSISETGDYISFAQQNSISNKSDVYTSYLNSGSYATPSISVSVTGTLYSYGQVSRDGKYIAICNWGTGYTIQIGTWDNTNKKYANFYNISTSTTYTSNSIGFSPDNNILVWYSGGTSLYYSVYNTSSSKFDTTVSAINVYDTDGTTLQTPTNSQSLIITKNGKLYNGPRFTSGNPFVYNVTFSGTGPSMPITDISFDIINTKQVALGNVQVSINDANNSATNNLYYWYSVNSPTTPNANSYALNTGSAGSPYKFYVPTTDISNTIYVQAKNASGNTSNIANIKVISYIKPQVPPIFNATLVGSGNIQVTVGEGSPSFQYYYLNNVSYVAYLYTGGTNQSGNISYYTYNVGILANTNTTYGNVVSYIPNLSANTYTVYLAAKNAFGNSLPTTISQSIAVYTTPGNVSLSSATTVAPGNVLVSITDVSNTNTANNVYYFYSTDGTTFANSNILAGSTASPYSLYLNIPDISNTIYVRATNTIGNSATVNIKALVFQTPRNPPIFGVSLVGGGNLQVTVGEIDTPNTIPNYYYLNNVSYVAYLYTGGTNQSGNLSYYTYNVGILSNTNTTYGNVVSYIPNLSANTYTVYLAAKNSVGNTISAGANRTVAVYTAPGNISAISATTFAPGNLLVSITDVSNTNTANNVYYFYSTDGTTFANSNILAGSTASPYSLYLNIPDISNTIYVKASNSQGNSATVSIQTILYQTPRNPPIFGVSLVGGGNLQVTVGEIDTPSTIPNYYYLNNVSYVAYLYTGGTNQSGNLSYYTYNVGILANTNTTYGNVVSYIPNLSANTYTVYLAAKNSVGNTISSGANRTVTVYSVPSYAPVIDTGNTYLSSSGNLTITFTDSFNDPANGISYSYYLYDSTANQYILLQ